MNTDRYNFESIVYDFILSCEHPIIVTRLEKLLADYRECKDSQLELAKKHVEVTATYHAMESRRQLYAGDAYSAYSDFMARLRDSEERNHTRMDYIVKAVRNTIQ